MATGKKITYHVRLASGRIIEVKSTNYIGDITDAVSKAGYNPSFIREVNSVGSGRGYLPVNDRWAASIL